MGLFVDVSANLHAGVIWPRFRYKLGARCEFQSVGTFINCFLTGHLLVFRLHCGADSCWLTSFFLLSRDALSRTARRRFGRGLIASCAKWSAAVSSRSAESFIQRTSLRPCSHGIRIDTLPASACSNGQGALLRKSAQGHPGSRLPLISPSGGCWRRTAPLPARSSAARAASRPARSSCPGP